jgi:hypothetical protein
MFFCIEKQGLLQIHWNVVFLTRFLSEEGLISQIS